MSTFEPNTINMNTVVKDKVETAAAFVLSKARAVVPQDTGNLARSLTMVDVSTGGHAAYLVGTNVHYGPFVEFGTYRMRAQPYLGPALAAARARYS